MKQIQESWRGTGDKEDPKILHGPFPHKSRTTIPFSKGSCKPSWEFPLGQNPKLNLWENPSPGSIQLLQDLEHAPRCWEKWDLRSWDPFQATLEAWIQLEAPGIPSGYSSIHLPRPTLIPEIGAAPPEKIQIPMSLPSSQTFQGISVTHPLHPKIPSIFSPKNLGKKAQVMGIVLQSHAGVSGHLFLTSSENSKQRDSKSRSFPVGCCGILMGFSKEKSGAQRLEQQQGSPRNSVHPPLPSPHISQFSKGLDSLPATGNSTWSTGIKSRPH